MRALSDRSAVHALQEERQATLAEGQAPELSINLGTIPAPEEVFEQLQGLATSLGVEQLQSLAAEFGAFGTGAVGNLTNQTNQVVLQVLQGDLTSLDVQVSRSELAG